MVLVGSPSAFWAALNRFMMSDLALRPSPGRTSPVQVSPPVRRRTRPLPAARAPEEDLGPNPFAFPRDTADVFQAREQEQRERAEEKRAAKAQHVWNKHTASSRTGRAPHVKALVPPPSALALRAESSKHADQIAELKECRRRAPRDSVNKLVSHSREVFLLTMSHDTKVQEIRKLESMAQAREDKVKKMEVMLEEDAIRFDAFLKQNDAVTHEAIRSADKISKAKGEKLAEIKKLKQAISIVESDTSRLMDQLQTLERYREEQARKKAARKEQRRAARLRVLVAEWEKDVAALEAAAAKEEEEERRRAFKEGRLVRRRAHAEEHLPPKPTLEEVEVASSGSELPMYFTRAPQLLNMFTQLEESNLFLIQNCQDSEQQLEELRLQYRESQKSLGKHTDGLTENAKLLHRLVSKEQSKADALHKVKLSWEGTGPGHDEAMAALFAKIAEAYAACGFQATAHPEPLHMLAAIESKMDQLQQSMRAMAAADPEYVVKRERELAQSRREKYRVDRAKEQDEAEARRVKVMLERAQAAPSRRRTGKPVMFRSMPPRKKEEVTVVDPAKEQERLDMKFLQ